MRNHFSMPILHKYTVNRAGICGEGLEDYHVQTGPCNSIEKEQPFCIHVSKSKQRRMTTCCLSWMPWETFKSTKRYQEVVFWVKMSWSSHVIMSYAIYSYVLMSGGLLEITWEVKSGQNVPWVVLSVRGCLLWGNSE